jgi:hypothetical protein
MLLNKKLDLRKLYGYYYVKIDLSFTVYNETNVVEIVIPGVGRIPPEVVGRSPAGFSNDGGEVTDFKIIHSDTILSSSNLSNFLDCRFFISTGIDGSILKFIFSKKLIVGENVYIGPKLVVFSE